MKRNIYTGIALLLLAGCLLASCGEHTGAETSSAETSSAETSAAEVVSTEETTSEGTSSAEETASEVTSSEGTSSEPVDEPAELSPLPEDLPGLDSPEPPKEQRIYLPASGYTENMGIDSPPLTYTFTYGKDSMVMEQRGDNGIHARWEYRFDAACRLLEENGAYEGAGTFRNLYTYDGAGRMTSWTNIRQVFDERVTEKWEYVYGEDGKLEKEVYSLTDAEGETHSTATTYTRTYDENGVLTQMVETEYNGNYTEHVYKDGLERVMRYCDKEGKLSYAYAYDYDEQGRLTRERFRGATMEVVVVDDSLYEGERLAEIVRREADGSVYTVYRYGYDDYGRLLVEFGNDWGSSYDVFSYDERGSLCGQLGYYPRGNGNYELMKKNTVDAWGDEAVTEMQRTFYRVAMTQIFGGSNTLEEQFYVVKDPTP